MVTKAEESQIFLLSNGICVGSCPSAVTDPFSFFLLGLPGDGGRWRQHQGGDVGERLQHVASGEQSFLLPSGHTLTIQLHQVYMKLPLFFKTLRTDIIFSFWGI